MNIEYRPETSLNNLLSNLYKFSTLLLGVFLFFVLLFGGANVAEAASLPTVASNSNTKLLEAGGVYYYAFTSSTADEYHLFVATSTDGVSDNWSIPVDVFGAGIFPFNVADGHPDIQFGFDYNSVGGYFGAVIVATGTSEIWFTTSTNSSSWSATTTVVSGIELNVRNSPALTFSKSENLAAIFYRPSGDQTNVKYSTDNGGNWTAGTVFSSCSNCVIKGAKVSGSGSNRVFHVIYLDNNSSGNYPIYYASSTNDASSWTTTTIANAYIFVPSMGSNIGFDRLIGFDVDSDGLPGFTYYQPTAVGSSMPLDVTSTIVFAKKSSGGSWVTSTILSGVYLSINDTSQKPSYLYFFNGNKPIFTGFGSNNSLAALVNTSSAWMSYDLSGGTLGSDGGLSSVYSTSSQNWATSFVLNDGSLQFATTSLPTYAPTTTSIFPVQILPVGDAAGNVSVTTTVSDLDGSDVNLLVEMSDDGFSWSSTVIGSPSASVGSVTTSTSSILGIDTSSGSNNLSFNIDISQGGGIDGYEGLAYVRITPYDIYYTGTPRVSDSFSLDLAEPAQPGDLDGNLVSTSSVRLDLPTTTSTDTNFSQYKIYYSATSPVTEASSAFTSSSDSNLADGNFNGATTAIITGLSPNTTYYFKIFAYDSYNNSTSSVNEFSTTTLDYYSGNLPVVSSDAKTKLLLVDGVYYMAFSSSTSGGFYRMYVVTSTSGVDGTWSRPVDVFSHGIFSDTSDAGNPSRGNFGFDYNSVSGYFGAAIYATSTGEIWFVTSTNAASWSATSTAVSGLSVFSVPRKVDLFFSKTENLAAVLYNYNNGSDVNISYSTNSGASWSQGSYIPLTGGSSFLGGGVSGSGLSRVFHLGYFEASLYLVVYASSSDNGTTWTTSTVASNVKGNLPDGPGDFGFEKNGSFDLDENGLPGFVYYQPLDSSGSGPFDVTSTVVYAHGSSLGVWTTSSIATVHLSINDSAQRASDLIFYNTDKPIFAGLGSDLSLIGGFNDGSGWATSTVTSSILNKLSDVGLVANTSSNIWAVSYVLNDGTLHFATSSLSDGGSPATPTGLSISQIATSTALASWSQGVGGNEDAFYLEIFLNSESNLVGSSTSSVIQTTSSLSGLIPNSNYIFRVSSILTGVSTSTAVTSSFYTSSTDPISLTVSNVSTSTLTFSWDANNNPTSTSYRVTGGELDDDVVATSTSMTVLPNKTYTLTVRSRNNDSSFNSAVSASATTTLAAIPGTPSAIANGQTSLVVSWSDNYNVTTTVYELYNVTNSSVVTAVTTSTSVTVTGLTAGTAYQFKVRAQYNSDNSTWTDYSDNSSTVSTAAASSSGGGSISYYTLSTTTTSIVVTSTASLIVPTSIINSSTGKVIVDNQAVSVLVAKIFATVLNPESAIKFSDSINFSYQPGTKVKFNYSYQNTSGKTLNIKVVRKLLDSKMKTVKIVSANSKLKPKTYFRGKVDETLVKNMKAGVYKEQVQILVNNKVVAENSFEIQVEKLKKKYFSLGAVTDTSSDVNFVESSLKQVKSNLSLPSSFSYIYSYPLSAHKKQVIRLSRDLVDPNGKVIESITGRWNIKSGEPGRKFIRQTLSDKMINGDYRIRIRVFDDKTKVLLAENSLEFNIELK